jgi:thiol:disulfide interchange protein DsbD
MVMRATKPRNRVLAIWLALAMLLSGGLLLRAAPGEKGKRETTADRIDFQVSVTSDDPFSPNNAVDATKKVFRRGEVVRLVITGTPRAGFHTYPITVRSEDQDEIGLSTLSIEKTAGLQPLWPIVESKPEFVDTKLKDDKNKQNQIWLEYDKKFTWEQDILILPDAQPGPKTVKFQVHVQVCNENSCLWGDHPFEAAFEVSAAAPLPLSAELKERMAAKEPAIKVLPVPASFRTPATAQQSPKTSPAITKAGPDAVSDPSTTPAMDGGLLAFILSGIFWGAVSLATPCVFPMIPITVSLFLKQSEKEHHKPLAMASVYCGTIIVVLTVAAIALLSFFRALSTNYVMNFGLGLLFCYFALSLFGMYEIELPAGLARFTQSKEGQGGYVGVMFMALTFTIISFACVAPFLGGFGGTAAGGRPPLHYLILGGLAFSTTFASPFFLLALFPTALKKLPKSGSWLNNVKVVMGFLELAAALKFLRTGELLFRDKPAFFTYDLVLGLYVTLAILCGLYLLGLYRLPHDSPQEHLGVPQLLLSIVFLALGFYLLPGLFKDGATGDSQRPRGIVFAWVDSFLLPDPQDEGAAGVSTAANGKEPNGSKLVWLGSLQQGIEEALKDRRLIFVDFTGESCTNCRLNERNVFPRPTIQDLFRQYTLVQLYTDKVPNRLYPAEEQAQLGSSTAKQRADAQRNLEFQREMFNDERLPLYVILKPLVGGKWEQVAVYRESLINDIPGFAQFLKQPLAALAQAGEQASAKPTPEGR